MSLLLVIGSVAPATAETTLVMGTGLPGGNYNEFGRLFAEVINSTTAKSGIRIKLRPTDGSVSNVKGLSEGWLQLGLVQADVEYMAYKGLGLWKKAGPQKNLRTIYELYSEAVTCVASVASGIHSCADLNGKRVAIGSEGSGTRTNALQAMSNCWLKPSDLSQALSINPPQAMLLMQQGKLDAFFYTVSHPNTNLKKFVQQYGNAFLVPLEHTKAMAETVPYYMQYYIWKTDYPAARNTGSMISTYGIKSYLLTTDKVAPEVINKIARLFFFNLEHFKKKLPPMRALEPPTGNKLGWSVSAPYHQGVLNLFR